MKLIRIVLLGALIAGLVLPSCSSPGYKTQAYAKLPNTKDFEEDYPIVWKAALNAVGEYKVEDKDQDKGYILTDWIYSSSNEKYVEYRVNGFPRRKYLQTRYKLAIKLDKQIGSVKVTVTPQEEIEKLKSDGTSDGWKAVSDFDTIRANEMIHAIDEQILSRHN